MRDKIFVLKITLAEITPQIWRRLTVPASISLDRLHDVIQIVMGWDDYHLHQFNIEGVKYTEDLDEYDEDKSEIDGEYRLGDLVKRKGAKFTYLYDYGDSWMHNLVLEKTGHTLGRQDEPITCLGGKRACPPEDVGSVPGYYEYCKAVADKNHPEHVEMIAWRGDGFDAEKFDKDKVNLELLKYLRWSRERHLP